MDEKTRAAWNRLDNFIGGTHSQKFVTIVAYYLAYCIFYILVRKDIMKADDVDEMYRVLLVQVSENL